MRGHCMEGSWLGVGGAVTYEGSFLVGCVHSILSVWLSSTRPWRDLIGSSAFWEPLEGSREQLQRTGLGLGKGTR